MATPRLLVLTTRFLKEEVRGLLGRASGDEEAAGPRRPGRGDLLRTLVQEPSVWLQSLLVAVLWAMVGGSQNTVEVLHMQAVWLQALVAAGAWAAAGGGGAQGVQNTGSLEARAADGLPPQLEESGECQETSLALLHRSPGRRFVAEPEPREEGGTGIPAGRGGSQPRPRSFESSRWLKALVLGGGSGGEALLAPLRPEVAGRSPGAGLAALSGGAWPPLQQRQQLLAASAPPRPAHWPQARQSGNLELLGLLEAAAAREEASAGATRTSGWAASQQYEAKKDARPRCLALEDLPAETQPAAEPSVWDLLWDGLYAADLMPAPGSPTWSRPVQDSELSSALATPRGVGGDLGAVAPGRGDREVADPLGSNLVVLGGGEACPIAGLFWLMLCGVLVGLV